MTFLGPYDGKQSLYGEILDVFCKKSEHWLPTGVLDATFLVQGVSAKKIAKHIISAHAKCNGGKFYHTFTAQADGVFMCKYLGYPTFEGRWRPGCLRYTPPA